MSKRFAGRAGQVPIRYRIVIGTTIDEPFVGPLEGMTVKDVDGGSVLTGDFVDQSQLQGALNWLNALGVEIVSVNPEDGENEH